MATKKSSVKASPPSPILIAALKAASSPEVGLDAKHDMIFQCIVAAFDQEGLNHISSPTAKIVWSTIDDDVILSLGDDVTTCIRNKGSQCPQFAPAFQALKNNNLVSVVSDLVSTLAHGVTP